MANALVLGGGIMGLSAAWGLSRAGWSVRVVEQDSVPNPRGSSVDDHRLIRHAYGGMTGYMRMIDPAYAAWRLLFAEAGETPYVQTGVLSLANAPGGWLAASRAALRGDGHVVTDLAAADIVRDFPYLSAEGIADAFHLPSGGVLLARRIVEILAESLRKRGVTFQSGRAVALDPARAAMTLDTGETLQADLLVIAAGPWGPRLLPALAPRVRPSRQIIVRLAPPPELAATWEAAPMLLDLAEDGGFYAVPPVAGTPLKIGDHRFAPHGDPEDPREATDAEAAEILDFARHRILGLDRYRVLSAAACYYDVEAREEFVVEPLGQHAFVLSGFSGHGFKFGALLGLALARAAGDPTIQKALPGWAAGRDAPPPGLFADIQQELSA